MLPFKKYCDQVQKESTQTKCPFVTGDIVLAHEEEILGKPEWAASSLTDFVGIPLKVIGITLNKKSIHLKLTKCSFSVKVDRPPSTYGFYWARFYKIGE